MFAYEGNPDCIDGGINFNKMRLVLEIVKSLKMEKPDQLDYSFLELDPQIATAILNANPLTQDELYDRSLQISESLANHSLITPVPPSPTASQASSDDGTSVFGRSKSLPVVVSNQIGNLTDM